MKSILSLALTLFVAFTISAQDSTKVNLEDQMKRTLENLEMKIDQLEWAEIQDKTELYINEHKPTKEDFEKFKEVSKAKIKELQAKDYSSIQELEKGFEHTFEDLGEIIQGISKDFGTMLKEMELDKPKKPAEIKQI